MSAMLRGIDISNNNATNPDYPFDLSMVLNSIDFAVMKATGGDWFVDGWCDKWVQMCIQHEVPWGFYHFGHDGSQESPYESADFFMENTINYFGHGIPFLDWERDTMTVAWVNDFVHRVHKETGVWCPIYANPYRFNQGGVEPNCMRWVADYPNVVRPGLDYNPGEPPSADGLVGMWQYASDGVVDGYSGNLDVNHFFGDLAAWNAYAHVPESVQPTPEPTSQSVLENDEYRVVVERK